jgi:glycosyltransferase involved in cell wall biosynthesis
LNPLVSICIPTYNGQSYLNAALDSAEAQTYSNFEIIISDDGSTDATLEIISKYKKDTNLSIQVFNNTEKGIGSNWNNCIKKANGDYIKFLFQDDLLAPNCISKMVEVAELSENIGLVYCKRNILYTKDNPYHKSWVQKYGSLHNKWDQLNVIKEKVISGKRYLKDSKLLKEPLNIIGEPTATLIAKKCFNKVGFFNEDMKQALDIEFWFRLMKDFEICFIDEKLISFRLHNQQASFLNKQKAPSEVPQLVAYMYKNYFWYLNFNVKLNKVLKIIKSRLRLSK